MGSDHDLYPFGDSAANTQHRLVFGRAEESDRAGSSAPAGQLCHGARSARLVAHAGQFGVVLADPLGRGAVAPHGSEHGLGLRRLAGQGLTVTRALGGASTRSGAAGRERVRAISRDRDEQGAARPEQQGLGEGSGLTGVVQEDPVDARAGWMVKTRIRSTSLTSARKLVTCRRPSGPKRWAHARRSGPQVAMGRLRTTPTRSSRRRCRRCRSGASGGRRRSGADHLTAARGAGVDSSSLWPGFRGGYELVRGWFRRAEGRAARGNPRLAAPSMVVRQPGSVQWALGRPTPFVSMTRLISAPTSKMSDDQYRYSSKTISPVNQPYSGSTNNGPN